MCLPPPKIFLVNQINLKLFATKISKLKQKMLCYFWNCFCTTALHCVYQLLYDLYPETFTFKSNSSFGICSKLFRHWMQKYYIIITFKPVNLNPILPSEFAQNCFCTFGPPAESRSLQKSEGPTD